MLQKTPKSRTASEILDRSRVLIAQRGYEAVSMRDIAEAVGIRPSSIYNHFPSKEALLEALMTGHMLRVLEAMTAALEGLDCPRARLSRFSLNHLLIHLDYPDDVFLAYHEIRSLRGDARREVFALRDSYEQILRDILSDGDARGLFRIGDPDVHGRALLAMLTGVTVWYRSDGPLDRQSVMATYLRAALQGVGLEYQDTDLAGGDL